MERSVALDRVETLLDTVESDPMPVPIREVWVYGDVALGLDPIERLNVYVTKDIHLRGAADAESEFVDSHGIQGVGKSVSATWAEQFPEYLRANESGYAAPEQCLAAHLLQEEEPVHLEVCNAPFDQNVTQRLKGALASDSYEQVLDPRGVQLWADGQRATDTLENLRGGELPFPTLEGALEMLGVDPERAEEVAEAVRDYQARLNGQTVRGEVV